MEYMGVASGCGEQEAGVASGCGCKEVYRFPHTTYPYSSCICSFCSSIPIFCSFFKMFLVLVPVHFVITFYVLNNFSHNINTHTGNYGRPTAAI